MENATKALEMAGSVLIGILILGCIVYMYNQVATVKKINQDSIRIEQASDFNKDYDAYNRDNLYGSDLFSLANLIENYNKKESDDKDYGKIEIKVNIKTPIINAEYFVLSEYNAEKITDAYEKLANKIRKIGTKVYFSKDVSYWSNYGTSSRLEQQLQQELGSSKYDSSTSKINELKNYILEYNQYLSEQKDMARKNFKCSKMEYYSNTGRIKLMEFEEI